MKNRFNILLLIVYLGFYSLIFAETINFKSGQRLENVKITEKTDEYIKAYNYSIRDNGQDIGFVVTYKTNEIESLEPDKNNRKHSVMLNKIMLKSGNVKMGTIVDANKDNIMLEDADGLSITCSWDDVDTVNGEKAEDFKSIIGIQ